MAKNSNDQAGNTQHIGKAIEQLLKTYRIKTKFDEANLINSWERLVGKSVAKRTKKVFLRDKVLFVELESAAMKSDLNLHKTQILQLFAAEFGPDLVREIVIM